MTDSPLVLSYRTAEQLLRHNRSQLVFGDTVRPAWLTGDHRFRYSKQSPDGVRNFLVDPRAGTHVSPILTARVWWERDGSAVYYLESAPDLRTLRLNRIDPGTGEVRTLIEEHGATRVEPTQWMMRRPMVRVFDNGQSTLWYSQRDGWGHLYHYRTDTDAAPVQVTSGRYVVEQILRVDEDERVVHFLAAGSVAADPYRRQVCRIALDGTGFTRISDDDLDHEVNVPGHEEYFVDSASATDTPPVITVRDWDGKLLVELERADVSRLRELGWRPPERFRATAADGSTDIYGLLYLPHDFDPRRRYPVIDHLYPGPHTTRVSPGFAQGMSGPEAEALAALGFAVVAIDGRGTPGRDKAFHDASYGHLGDAGGLDDHLAAIRELARTRPWLDLDRVGATGHSGGGYATVRALCAHPDFYTVGVAESGDHDPRIYHQFFGESYDGPYDDEMYRQSVNLDIADRLRGKLLLMHGELDNNVTPQHTLRLVDRLIAADKDFDLIIVPGTDHFINAHPYVIRRRWDFLIRHLHGVEPPTDHRLTPISPGQLDAGLLG